MGSTWIMAVLPPEAPLRQGNYIALNNFHSVFVSLLHFPELTFMNALRIESVLCVC